MDLNITHFLKRNARVIEMQCDGISHEASLTQSSANINCLNWTVGHIVVSRNDMIEALGGDRIAIDLAAYERESEPITGPGPGVVELDALLDGLRSTQARLEELTTGLDSAGWAATDGDDPKRTLADRIGFLYFHDTYHTGQTDLLRQISGANDKVI